MTNITPNSESTPQSYSQLERTKSEKLQKLARQIEDCHQGATKHAQIALESALDAGQYLNEVKELLPHGRFTEWVSNNFSSSMRTAQSYMRVARERALIESKSADSALLTVDGALKLIADSRVEEAETERASAESCLAQWMKGYEQSLLNNARLMGQDHGCASLADLVEWLIETDEGPKPGNQEQLSEDERKQFTKNETRVQESMEGMRAAKQLLVMLRGRTECRRLDELRFIDDENGREFERIEVDGAGIVMLGHRKCTQAQNEGSQVVDVLVLEGSPLEMEFLADAAYWGIQ